MLSQKVGCTCFVWLAERSAPTTRLARSGLHPQRHREPHEGQNIDVLVEARKQLRAFNEALLLGEIGQQVEEDVGDADARCGRERSWSPLVTECRRGARHQVHDG